MEWTLGLVVASVLLKLILRLVRLESFWTPRSGVSDNIIGTIGSSRFSSECCKRLEYVNNSIYASLIVIVQIGYLVFCTQRLGK